MIERAYKTDAETRLASKLRRDKLASEGLCINGATHGAATHGVRCKRCYSVHKGENPPARQERTCCKWGHAFTLVNTRLGKDGGKECRTCHRIRGACRRRGFTREQIASVYERLLAVDVRVMRSVDIASLLH